MREGLREVVRGIRPVDWLLVGVLAGLGVWEMADNLTTDDADVARQVALGEMSHQLSSRSAWMIPVWILATVPVLWWRRSVPVVTGIALAAVVLHDLMFGLVGRCGAGLPLAFALAFLGAVGCAGGAAWLSLVLSLLLTGAVVWIDAITGPGVLVLAVPIVLLLHGVGRAVRQRIQLSRELKTRTAELRRLRDQRAAIEVADDRARLSRQLDDLLQERLGQLGRAADSAGGLDAAGSRALLESIEADSRRTLQDMREIVGLLRGGDVALAPAPTVAHLDALLARHGLADSRLSVTGDPRSLPASVELSVYRIVEHLVTTLADRPDSRIEVAVRFGDDAVEIRVSGLVENGADVRAAAARARQRAALLGGWVDVKIAKGWARAVAQLPVAW